MSLRSDDQHEIECGCYCKPPGNIHNRDRYVIAFRCGVIQIMAEVLLLFICFGYIYMYPAIGFWLFISFLLMIISVSTAVCCCPSHSGWRLTYLLSSTAYAMRTVFCIICIVIVSTTKHGNTKIAMYLCKSNSCVSLYIYE